MESRRLLLRPMDIRNGSTVASRFSDPNVRLLSFDQDREAADIRENPGLAFCCRPR